MWYNNVEEIPKSELLIRRYKMNNVINRNYNCNSGRESSVYNEAFGERLVSFFCVVIAFFESAVVNTVCRLVGAVAVVVGIFFYASALMSGALSIAAVLVYALLLAAASALIFKTDIKHF